MNHEESEGDNENNLWMEITFWQGMHNTSKNKAVDTNHHNRNSKTEHTNFEQAEAKIHKK